MQTRKYPVLVAFLLILSGMSPHVSFSMDSIVIPTLPIQCWQGFHTKDPAQTRIKPSWRSRTPSLASSGLRKPFGFDPLHAGLSKLTGMTIDSTNEDSSLKKENPILSKENMSLKELPLEEVPLKEVPLKEDNKSLEGKNPSIKKAEIINFFTKQPITEKEDSIIKEALSEPKRLLIGPEFLKIFGLRSEEAVTFPKGVYAIELEVDKVKYFPQGVADKFFNRNDFTAEQYEKLNEAIPAFQIWYMPQEVPYDFDYHCYLNVYIDNDEPLLYPDNGDLGDKKLSQELDKEAFTPIFAHQNPPKKWQPPKYPNFESNYDYKAFLSSKENQFMLPYSMYFKKVIYNVNYIRLGPDINCMALANSIHQENPQIWLEKMGRKDYQPKEGQLAMVLDKNDFYPIDLPQQIIHSDLLKEVLKYEKGRVRKTP